MLNLRLRRKSAEPPVHLRAGYTGETHAESVAPDTAPGT
jgi:hypothetical protein